MTPMQQDQQHQPKPPPPAGAKQPMNPRLNGALLLGLGLAFEAFNGFTIVNDSTFYPKLLILGTVLMPLGGWTLVTGISYDKNAAEKPPTWWTAGAVILCVLGLIAGIGVMVMLES